MPRNGVGHPERMTHVGFPSRRAKVNEFCTKRFSPAIFSVCTAKDVRNGDHGV
jgi:hypothetical protein